LTCSTDRMCYVLAEARLSCKRKLHACFLASRSSVSVVRLHIKFGRHYGDSSLSSWFLVLCCGNCLCIYSIHPLKRLCSVSSCRFPAVIVTCRVSSLIGWNSHTKPSTRRPLRQLLNRNLHSLDGQYKGRDTVLRSWYSASLNRPCRGLLRRHGHVMISVHITPPPPPSYPHARPI
jgi:hypothetical protein